MSKGKKILIIIVAVFLITATIIYIKEQFKPLSEDKRNMSTKGIKLLVEIEDELDRTPIIRSYTREEYNGFNERELRKIRQVVSGNIEGDIPTVIIGDRKGSIKFHFELNDRVIGPDNTPLIKIFPLDTIYSHRDYELDDLLVVEDLLIEDKKNMTYKYEVQRYLKGDYMYQDGDEQFLTEANLIELEYEIDNNSYVSIFGINIFEEK